LKTTNLNNHEKIKGEEERAFMSLVAHQFGHFEYLLLFFQLRLPEENNNSYPKFKIRLIQIDELPRALVIN